MENIKKDIIDVGRRLYLNGYISANDGNLSVRLDEKRILTTPSGMNKGELSRDDLVVVDLSGKKLSGKREPSSELNMHLFVYRERPDVGAVVHAHPPYCTGFATAGIALDRCVLPEVILSVGAIPLAPYATPSTGEVAESLRKLVPGCDAVMLANHGAVTLGKNIVDAYWKMERIEHAAKISYVAQTLGGQKILPKEEVKKLHVIREASGGGPAPKCWSCDDCVGEACVLHQYKGDECESCSRTGAPGEIQDIVKRVLAAMTK